MARRKASCQHASAVLSHVTEAANVITSAIDIASPAECVQLLNQCDAQIFAGWSTYNSLYSPSVIKTILSVAMETAKLLQNAHDCAIVLSGCGTSGRLAFLIARTFNARLQDEGIPQRCYSYIVAGGDRALLKSVEGQEDSYQAGVESLTKAASGKKTVLFIGISCGLSAPFVAGQLDHCLSNLETFTPVLVGFNPISFARKTSIKDWDKTFYDITRDMENAVEAKSAYILNPVVGPEAIAGSTRMKSGTATKILLEVVFSCAHHLYREMRSGGRQGVTPQMIHRCLESYELVYRQTYLHSNAMTTLLEMGAESLYPSNSGHIYYLGDASSLSIMSMIDASECPPTYGAAHSDVRAFVKNSYDTLCNEEGDLQHLGPEYCIDWSNFIQDCLPCISHDDLVVFVGGGGGGVSSGAKELVDLCGQVKEKGGRTALVRVTSPKDPDMAYFQTDFDVEVRLNLPWDVIDVLWPFHCNHDNHDSVLFAEVAVKWVLNALTTGAHVMKGKVYGNKMVDLQVSNTKLYHRAVGIVQSFCGTTCEPREAEGFLQKAICSLEGLEEVAQFEDISQYVKMAAGKQQVVPLALLIASGLFSGAEAMKALDRDPVINRVLTNACTRSANQ